MNKIEWKMGFAEQAAKKSHDAETKVGAALFNKKDGSLISIGYNGFVRNAADHLLPNKRPDKYIYILHAEQNLIINCARNGHSMKYSELFCTMSPCVLCMRMMYNAGVTTIYCKELYRDFNDIIEMLDISVKCEQIPVNGYYKLTYKGYRDV